LDASEALLRRLVEVETDPALRGRIFDGLRFHFTFESEALLERELEASTSWMVPEEIQKALYVFACLRGASEPELEGWRSLLASMGELDIYFHIPFNESPGR
ncbi:MAG: hypothetical protein ACRD21_11060, partial [Vicinamibacteria bacterium]